METIRKKTWLIMIALVMMPWIMNSQEFSGKCLAIPGLNEEQQGKIEKMKTAHQKEMLTLKNQLGENRARYRTLMAADKADMDAINKNIDEFTKIRNEMMKKKASHIQEVRSLLSDEQKLFFDTHPGKGKGMMAGGHMFGGKGPGAGKGMGPHRECPCLNGCTCFRKPMK